MKKFLKIPKVHSSDSERQVKPFSLQIQRLEIDFKVEFRIFIFGTLGTNGLIGGIYRHNASCYTKWRNIPVQMCCEFTKSFIKSFRIILAEIGTTFVEKLMAQYPGSEMAAKLGTKFGS